MVRSLEFWIRAAGEDALYFHIGQWNQVRFIVTREVNDCVAGLLDVQVPGESNFLASIPFSLD